MARTEKTEIKNIEGDPDASPALNVAIMNNFEH